VSMFTMFNALNRGERASGPERLPRSVWARPWLTRAAALLAMAALIAGGLLLSARTRPGLGTCLMLTAAGGTPVTVSGATSAASARTAGLGTAAGPGSGVSDHESPCATYPAKK
jgi:hypothetical protein